MVTFNVRTLKKIGQLPELTVSAIDKNIDIICIQEFTDSHIASILISRFWQWIDAIHSFSIEKLC